jgi:hypothetical protein
VLRWMLRSVLRRLVLLLRLLMLRLLLLRLALLRLLRLLMLRLLFLRLALLGLLRLLMLRLLLLGLRLVLLGLLHLLRRRGARLRRAICRRAHRNDAHGPGVLRRYHVSARKCARPRGRRDRRYAVVHAGTQGGIAACGLHMLLLGR